MQYRKRAVLDLALILTSAFVLSCGNESYDHRSKTDNGFERAVASHGVQFGKHLATTDYRSPEINIAVLGTSISAGLFADSVIGQSLQSANVEALRDFMSDTDGKSPNAFASESPRDLDKQFPNFLKLVIDVLEVRQGTEINDTIAAIFDIFEEPSHAAASTGEEWGLRAAIAAASDQSTSEIIVNNFAQSGAWIGNAHYQLDQLAERYSSGASSPAEYVVFEFGVNDKLYEQSDWDNFEQGLAATLERTVEMHPGATILVPAIPHPGKARDLIDPDEIGFSMSGPLVQELWQTPTEADVLFRCNGIQFVYVMGKVHAQNNHREKNQILAATASSLNGRLGTRLIFIDTLGDDNLLRKDHYAGDCYHPGLEGHKEIARHMITALPTLPVTGDANRDGRFDEDDLLQVFDVGKYEENVVANWGEGDWNHDGRFNSDDLLAAFEAGFFQAQ